ncbi:hypothetical protein DPV78_009125 [Talaromyces pinophilus]|nr:hypothetical protein DPV78_009125 [Talaromyces pinophilus]
MFNLPSWLQTLPGLTVTLDQNPGNDLLSRLIQNWSVANTQSRQGGLVSHHASLYPTRKILDLTLNQITKSSSLGSLPSRLLDQIIAVLIRHVISSRAALLKFWHQIGCRISNGRDALLRLLLNIKKSIPWFVHLPKAIAQGISRWVRSTLQTIGDGINNITNASIRFFSALVRALTITAVITLALVAFALVVKVLVSAYREHQLKVELKRQREEYERREQERIRRQEEERRREREGEYERQRKEQERRERERKQREENHRREQDEQERRRQQNEQEQFRRSEAEHKAYNEWRQRREDFFENIETRAIFPDPPFWPCSAGCRESEGLKACRHSIKKLYRASGCDLGKLIKEESQFWHPDKFSRCLPSARDDIKAKATEMSKIINALKDETQL